MGSAEPTSGSPASSFLQRLSNGHMGTCLGVPVQICPKTCSNEFLRIFQLKNLFLDFLLEKAIRLEKILACKCKNGKFKYALGKIKLNFEKGNMR
jgi:hypothetical protein